MRWVSRRIGWATRSFLLGRGPLKRGTDGVQMLMRLLVLVAVIAAAPTALLVASAVRPHPATDARPHVESVAVQAVLLTEPFPRTYVVSSGVVVGAPVARVAWTTASGAVRSVLAPVPPGAHIGDRVTARTNRTTKPAQPPPQDPAERHLSGTLGALTLMCLPLLTWVLYLLVRLALDARRDRQWEVGWSAVEPAWSARHL
jgi:hypothetical protein